MSWITEPERRVKRVGVADVLVCGGGPSGVAAAVAAARSGARVRLLETHGCLGGIWTSGGLSWMNDCNEKRGLMKELIAIFQARDIGGYARGTNVICDTEGLKLVLEELVLDAGVEVRLHTRVVAAHAKGGVLQHVVTESKSGREAWGASVFIDCTGDGDLGALSGARFEVGKPESGETQPLSLIALVGGIDPEKVRLFNNSLEYAVPGEPKPKQRLRDEMVRAGVPPSYTLPALFHVSDDRFLLMANHEYGVSATDADALTRATFRARAELHKMIGALRLMGGVWSNLRLISTAPQIGVREGRRLHGLYTVSEEDLHTGAKHPDAVCRCTFGIDVHSTNPKKNGQAHEGVNTHRTLPYDIPLRSLISADVTGMMMAGRCISGDFLAHSSYRVTGDAVELGQGAGVAAAIAVRHGLSPQQLTWELVGPALERVRRESADRTQAFHAVHR